jgi:hypothetical protein
MFFIKKIFFIFLFILSLTLSAKEAKDVIKAPYTQHTIPFFLTGDFLYWKTSTDTLNTPWQPGFRVGIGSFLPHDDWQIFLEYTRLSFHSSHSKIFYSQTFNNLDLTLGKYIVPSQATLFFPFFGLQATTDTWNQHFPYLIKQQEVKKITQQKFWGIGILMGFNSEWLLLKYLRLFGNVSLAALSSHVHCSRKDSFSSSGAYFINTKNSLFTIQPMFDLEIGLKTDVWLDKDKHHLSLQGGWELQIWPWQNHCSTFNIPCTQRRALSFQGLSLKARWDF